MYNLACLYLDGRGVEQDSISAMEWMLRAAERGNAYAQVKLAWMHENGVGISKIMRKLPSGIWPAHVKGWLWADQSGAVQPAGRLAKRTWWAPING